MNMVTLGIGTPSDIAHFVLFGLAPLGFVIDAVSVRVVIPSDDQVVVLPAADVNLVVPTGVM